MMKAICWNASGINTKRALERLQTLKKAHNLSIIAIVEPFADQSHIAIVKLQLQMDQAVSNPNGKIWLFWSTNVTVQVLEKHDQHIIVTFQHTTLRDKFMMSFVYAKCKEYTRRSLWDRLLLYSNIDLSWCTIGDFNVITSIEEKLGGIPYNMNKSLEFIGVIEAYGLTDLGYTGLPYTWCNQRDAEARVWKRLNKSMVNDKWLENLPQTTIENLSSVGSDHSPLLMEMIQTNQSHTKYFKFLHCWVENGNFMITVQQCWDQVTTGHPMWKLHMKMNRLTSTLSKWSKLHGDIFTKVREFEKSIRKSEEELMTNNTEALRQKLHKMNATYIRYLKLEEAILQQKTQLHWFQEGDAHTKYFHALMRGRRRRLFLHKICIENEVWIQGEERIAQAACDYYQHQFTGQNDRIDERILQYIPTIITSYQNEMLQAIPNIDELRQVVFAMNPYSVGPDGFGGNFYQVCWNIIKEDLLAAVQLFFCGHIIPKFMSHACLVLIPKTEQPSRFAELRRISLSNFTNKIISKVLSMRLATVLPLLLSDNQLGFVRGRSITESIMLAQEISHAFKKPQIGSNVVIKLDMAKAYDRVSWSFTCFVLRRFCFGELFIDLVWRIMSNNWYSIIINGHIQGFFHSTRGFKQGDPLSPALFILGAEVLTRMINSLHQIPRYKGFFMAPKGPHINHLSFADDVIIFASTDRHSLKLSMDTLGEYEHTFGQPINKSKSHFMVPDTTSQDIINTIQDCTNFSQKCSPITYLGCPLYIGRKRIIYYSHLVEKVSKKVCGWQARILSFGGRITFIKHVVQSIPIHTMTAISPPNTTIKYIEAIIGGFFWGRDQDKRKYHWASLEIMSLPCPEGGVGMRRLTDICTPLPYKQCKVDTSSNSTYKLNTDGSALNNPGKIGGGGILRDSNGTIIYAFAIPLGEGTNNQVEVQAASYGLNWCIQHGYQNIILEVDSELLTKWFLQIFDPSWRLNKFVQELQDIAKHCAYGHCVHTYREANSTTDLLSKQSHQHDIIQHYYTPNQLPKAAKEQQSTGMATTPPRKQLQPPDQAQSMRIPLNYKPQQGASSESSDNSSKLGRIEAIHIAISEEELDWARKIISLEQSGKI
ncbi:hypothetical protein MTR67_023577 [Solanum verrucosum]|uniref:Reverse transcriptase domain-containing protein n=1 Tax=Solanum verrucosum TaxID=315347 RepID=A0AAF0QTS1_SOLVR|nr:hypothetical protein MTR67_023577 [Solanum verrucosum]